MHFHHIVSRIVTGLLSAAACVALPVAAQQPDVFPNHAVQFIIPGTTAGGTYVLARAIADKYQLLTGQPAVVMPVPGASGILGVQKVTTAKPDGYTLLFGFNQLVTMNPNLLPNLPYDVEKDLQPVSLIADAAYVWIAHSSFPPNTVPEWIAHAKAQPGKITFATSGSGSAANLGAELFMQMTGTEMLQVPYKGDPTPDLLGGFVQLRMEPYATAVPLVAKGRVKALAVTGAKRLPSLPDVPTMSEFLPGYVLPVTYSVWVPAGTPKAVIDKLNSDLVKIAKMPEIAERMSGLSVRIVASSSADLQNETRLEAKRWADLIKTRNIKVDP